MNAPPKLHGNGQDEDAIRLLDKVMRRLAEYAAGDSALIKALAVYSDRERWLVQQKAAMREDFSWAKSAKEYFELYQSLLSKAK